MQQGDLAVCYASVWQAVYAVVEVASDPEHDPEKERWSWSFALRPLVAVRDLHDAPACEEVGIFPSSIWRHSYIRLSDEQFDRARSLISRAVVRSGYDSIADRYEEWASEWHATVLRVLGRLIRELAPGSRVLDLGCGSGAPVARALVEAGHDVTGADVSAAQLARARSAVPQARFVHADALELELAAESFDAVVSTFVLGHVPRHELPRMLRRIHGWLRPGGLALLTFGLSDTEGVVDEGWLGTPMFFSSFPPEVSRGLLVDAGLGLEWDAEVRVDVPFLWTLSRRLS